MMRFIPFDIRYKGKEESKPNMEKSDVIGLIRLLNPAGCLIPKMICNLDVG